MPGLTGDFGGEVLSRFRRQNPVSAHLRNFFLSTAAAPRGPPIPARGPVIGGAFSTTKERAREVVNRRRAGAIVKMLLPWPLPVHACGRAGSARARCCMYYLVSFCYYVLRYVISGLHSNRLSIRLLRTVLLHTHHCRPTYTVARPTKDFTLECFG